MTRAIIGIIIVVISVIAILLTINKKSSSPLFSISADPTIQRTETISLEKNRFIPTLLTVKNGQTINIVNNDTIAHQIQSNPHPSHTQFYGFNIGLLQPGESSQVLLTQPGSFGLHDHAHPEINARVVVQ